MFSVGRNHNLLLDETGNVFGWGSNERGQINSKVAEDYISTPIHIPTHNKKIKYIKSSLDLNLAVSEDGTVF